jgi:hypothetical protein
MQLSVLAIFQNKDAQILLKGDAESLKEEIKKMDSQEMELFCHAFSDPEWLVSDLELSKKAIKILPHKRISDLTKIFDVFLKILEEKYQHRLEVFDSFFHQNPLLFYSLQIPFLFELSETNY